MKVYTYFNDVEGLGDPELLEIWQQTWSDHGWTPVILTEEDAYRTDPIMFERFLASTLIDGRNHEAYRRACMLRWVAQTVATENSLHVDWDVMCNGLQPEQVEFCDTIPTFLSGSTCPCAQAATAKGWKNFAEGLEKAPFLPNFDYEALCADSTDQYGTHVWPRNWYHIQTPPLCKFYKEGEGWEDAPMVHFPNRLTAYPRSETVRAVMRDLIPAS